MSALCSICSVSCAIPCACARDVILVDGIACVASTWAAAQCAIELKSEPKS